MQDRSFTPTDRHESVLATLRAATASAHAGVEALPAMVRLTSPAVCLADYRRYLAALAPLYGALEPALYAALGQHLPPGHRADLGLRPKLPTLHRELASYGLTVPMPPPDPPPPSLSAAVGGLYVLEGATLGGRVVARHLRRYLGVALQAGGLLDFHGDDASAAWKRFGGLLDALAADGLIATGPASDAALDTFGRVQRALAAIDHAGCP